VNLVRRRLLIGSAVVGMGGVAAAAIHDGELGSPPQTIRGAVAWQEGTADAPTGVSGSGFVFFTQTEVAFIESAVGRLIPNDEVGPGGVEANVPFFSGSTTRWQVRAGRPFFPRRSMAQGHAGTGISNPIQSRTTVSRCDGSDR